MVRRAPSIWRRIGARLPEITVAIAIAVTLGTCAWLVWALGWS